MDCIDARFGRLVVIKCVGKKNGHKSVECLCDCGKVSTHRWGHVKAGRALSCGCLRRELTIASGGRNRKHGRTQTKEYQAWRSMKKRCLNSTDKNFHNYGERGITVCLHWKSSFENFLADMGECPSGLSLERVDNNGNYEPVNCRWATTKEQGNNRRQTRIIEFNGKSQSLTVWAEEIGIPRFRLWNRLIRYKWQVERAFEKKDFRYAN